MNQQLNILSAQINPTVGDTKGNQKIILDAYTKGVKQNADLVFLPECTLSGYYPEDLLLRPSYINELMEAIENIAVQTQETALAFGSPYFEKGNLYNSIIFCQNGSIQQTFHKTELPNYGVFDEKRHFQIPKKLSTIELNGINIGFPICEDLWLPYVCDELKKQGAQALLCANASPFQQGKFKQRLKITEERALEVTLPILYLNLWGGQDELIFDGQSFALNPNTPATLIQPSWKDSFFTCKIKLNQIDKFEFEKAENSPQKSEDELLYEGLKVSLHDYMNKTGFKKTLIGMSGGIDSALTAVLAADAIGPENVTCVMMPSPYNKQESIDDAIACCHNLGVKIENAPIEVGMKAFDEMVQSALGEKPSGVAAENIQSRIRGQILMAMSNQTGAMLLTTGNKSEMAVGYATLYGDMCGGYNMLKDIYKTDLFNIAKWRNTQSLAIPVNIIKKAPSAELKPDQQDSDSLPPYNILDDILKHLVEDKMNVEEIINRGFPKEYVEQTAKLLNISEYKRRQATPGPKISACAFERDWRMPLSGKYKY